MEENIQKKDWLNSISLRSNYLRGTNQTGIYRNLNPTFTTTASNWYGVGVNVNIPLTLIANRKDKISLQKLNHQIELNYLEELKNEFPARLFRSEHYFV